MSKRRMSNLARCLLARSDSLIPQWYPTARKSGEYWLIGNVRGEPGSSLKINSKSGQWRDFATSDAGSDLISLYAAKEKLSYREAAEALSNAEGLTHTQSDIEQEMAITPVPVDAPHPPLREGMPHPFKKGYQLSRSWEYRDGDGSTVAYVARFDTIDGRGKKQILPLSFFGDSGWQWRGVGAAYPLYGSELLSKEPDADVLLVEGEKAADSARSIFPHLIVVTWHGGVNRIPSADWRLLESRRVVYWPDADEPGRKSVDQIVNHLTRARVADLRVVQPPASLPKGWDLADEAPSSIDLMSLLDSSESADLSSANAFLELDEEGLINRLVFVAQTMQFFDVESGRRFDEAQLKSLFLNLGPSVPKHLLASPRLRKVIAYTYRPGVEHQIFEDEKGTRLLNLWVKPDIEVFDGDVAPFVEHLRYLCSTDEEFEHLVDMLAFIVQKPGEKLKSGIVLIGKQGTGKSFVGVALGKILGAENTAMVTSTEIRSDFNDWVEAKQLIVVEEVMTLGRREVMNRLKPLITEATIRVNSKHQRAYSLENAANFLFLSNYDDALKLETGDRRYFVVASDKDPMEAQYYKTLWAWMQENIGAVAYWLGDRDLSGFDPNARPPETEGKSRMIDAGRDEHEALIAELVDARAYPFEMDLVEISRVRESLLSIRGGQRFSQPQLQKLLRSAGAERLGQMKGISEGKEIRVSLWAVRNFAKYRAMSPHAVIELYTRGLRNLQ